MIIDFHVHLGKDKFDGGAQTVEELLLSMKNSGVTHSVVFPLNDDPDKLIEHSLDLLKKSKEHDGLIPFLRLNPLLINKPDLKQLLDKGFKGIKLHSQAQEFFPDNPELEWFYKEIQNRKLPILFHSKESSKYAKPCFILKVAKKFKELPVVIGHFFGDNLSLSEEYLSLSNLYCETSINSRTLRIKQFVEKGFERFLLGSDSPFDSQKVAILKIREAGLEEKQIKLILEENARKLLNM